MGAPLSSWRGPIPIPAGDQVADLAGQKAANALLGVYRHQIGNVVDAGAQIAGAIFAGAGR